MNLVVGQCNLFGVLDPLWFLTHNGGLLFCAQRALGPTYIAVYKVSVLSEVIGLINFLLAGVFCSVVLDFTISETMLMAGITDIGVYLSLTQLESSEEPLVPWHYSFEPSTFTAYLLLYRTSMISPDLSHLFGLLPIWFSMNIHPL